MKAVTKNEFFNRPDKKESADAGLALALLFMLLFLLSGIKQWIIAAVVIQLVSMLWPILLLPVAFIWFGLSRIIGKIMSTLLLTVVFLVLVVPLGLIRKWMGKDSMQLRNFGKNSDSVFVNRNHLYKDSDIKYPY